MGELHYMNERETFTVSHRKALSHHMPSNHFHSTYESYYLLSGEREFFVKDRTMVLQEGEIIIIAPNILHRTTNAEKPMHERLIVNMHEDDILALGGASREVLRPLFEQEYMIVKPPPQDRPAIDALAHQILKEMRGEQPGYELYAQTLALQLLVTCCRYRGSAPSEYPSPMHERISEIVSYMNANYMEELSLHRLAETFYVSPYYLSRFFKEATGFTFVEYLNSVRIKEAKQLLMRSQLKVSLIARKVGFGSVTHFGRVFKQITGHTPLYYRKGK